MSFLVYKEYLQLKNTYAERQTAIINNLSKKIKQYKASWSYLILRLIQ